MQQWAMAFISYPSFYYQRWWHNFHIIGILGKHNFSNRISRNVDILDWV